MLTQTRANQNIPSRDMNSVSLLHEAYREMKKHMITHIEEKNYFHCMGLQGFKRLHRFQARESFEFIMMIECLIIDHYGVEPEMVDVACEKCSKRGLIERLDYYAKKLEETSLRMNDIKTKLVVNNQHFVAGKIQKIIDHLDIDLKYAYRHLNYVKDVNGSLCDVHWYSDKIHDEYKRKEKSEQGRDIY